MLFHKARHFAQNSAGQAINEAVLIVPGYFNQAERRAMLQAAELADIKVLQLMNDYMAGEYCEVETFILDQAKRGLFNSSQII